MIVRVGLIGRGDQFDLAAARLAVALVVDLVTLSPGLCFARIGARSSTTDSAVPSTFNNLSPGSSSLSDGANSTHVRPSSLAFKQTNSSMITSPGVSFGVEAQPLQRDVFGRLLCRAHVPLAAIRSAVREFRLHRDRRNSSRRLQGCRGPTHHSRMLSSGVRTVTNSTWPSLSYVGGPSIVRRGSTGCASAGTTANCTSSDGPLVVQTLASSAPCSRVCWRRACSATAQRRQAAASAANPMRRAGWPRTGDGGSANEPRHVAPLRLILACRPGNSPSLLLGLPSSPLWHSLRQVGVSLPEPRPIRHAPSDRGGPASVCPSSKPRHRCTGAPAVAQGLGTRRRQHDGRWSSGAIAATLIGFGAVVDRDHAVAHVEEMTSRWREIAVAGHTGDADAARSALADSDPVARELGLGALLRMEVLTDDDLDAALADAAPSVRRRAAMIAGQRPGISLRALLDDPDGHGRRSGCMGMRRAGVGRRRCARKHSSTSALHPTMHWCARRASLRSARSVIRGDCGDPARLHRQTCRAPSRRSGARTIRRRRSGRRTESRPDRPRLAGAPGRRGRPARQQRLTPT